MRLFAEDRLQKIADFIIGKVRLQLKITENDTKTSAKLINGREVSLPQWFLQHQGHDLEKEIMNIFPQLRRFHREGELKKEIIQKVIDDLPELLSVDLLNLFKELQEI